MNSPEQAAPVKPPFIPYSKPTIEEDEIQEVVDSLRSGWITSGPKVAKFEEQFRTWLGRPHALAVTSATAGLHIVMSALDLKPEDEVITTSMTWSSTTNMVEQVGAQTVFADIDPKTFQIDVTDIARKITPHTKVIMPVHYGGQPSDLDAIRELIGNRPIHLIEDAAHALGTLYKGKLIGATGEAVIFSFHPIKNITTAEGGMILCGDDAFANRLRRLRFHGITRDAWKRYAHGGTPHYSIEEPGFKYNMTDLQAALGIRQFTKLERFNQARTRLALRYREMLQGIPEISYLSDVPYPAVNAWQLFVVTLNLDMLTVNRDEFIMALSEENIAVGLHFLAVHLQPYYREMYGYKEGDLPHTEKASQSLFSLPLYPLLKDEEQERVVETLRRLVKKYRR